MSGFVGKRWPVQLVEGIFLTFVLIKVWAQATHFHPKGKIISQGLIFVGLLGLILEPFKQNHSGLIFYTALIILGFLLVYKILNQSPINIVKVSIKVFRSFITDSNIRKEVLQNSIKSWYNYKTKFQWKLRNLKKSLRRSNVKFS